MDRPCSVPTGSTDNLSPAQGTWAMPVKTRWMVSAVAFAMTLAGCGGAGGGGGGLAFTPPPPPAPAPTPTPTPPPPAGPLGTPQQFPTLAFVQRVSTDLNGGNVQRQALNLNEAVGFRFSEATQSYEIEIAGYRPGKLVPNAATVGTTHDYSVTDGLASDTPQRIAVYLNSPDRSGGTITLTHTGYGQWFGVTGETDRRNFNNGVFAYGIATAAGDYTAYVSGTSENVGVGGQAQLRFNFGAGTLAGHMAPVLLDDWGPTPLGRYDFTQTVHGVGSTTFSGKFVVPGSTADSFFEGRFNGPRAAELMARWQAPYKDPYSDSWGTMFGVWAGKKD
jgi:hypothetical protein